MITIFKIFEAKSKLPNKGDYVFCTTSNSYLDKRIENYCTTHIGKVTEIQNRSGKGMLPTMFTIEYELPEDLGGFKVHNKIWNIKDIEYWSKNYEEVELLIKADKYNL
jgi:hypothetical protein